MATDYDKIYRETRHALGPPTRVIVDFFEAYAGTGASVLDIGCGQGRDALFIARLGHRVTAVDQSPAGIGDLETESSREALPVTCVIADLRAYAPNDMFDVVLADRTLHMLGKSERLDLLRRLERLVVPEGHVLIADEASNIDAFEAVFDASSRTWDTIRKLRGFLFMQRTDEVIA